MHKSTKETRRYDVRSEEGRWLGTFIVTHDGLVCCNTDYGSYSYWWHAFGDDIIAFLLQINTGYLLSKVSPRDEYDGDETEKAIKRLIIQARRDGDLSREDAREEWDLIGDTDLERSEGFALWLRDTRLDSKHGFSDLWELARRGVNRQAAMFAERVWPRFCQMLRDEIQKENR